MPPGAVTILVATATADWIAVAVVAAAALGGLRRGLIGTALSLAGLVGGVGVGARVGPRLLPGGAASPYTPLAVLAGALAGALLLDAVAAAAAASLRGKLLRLRSLGALDAAGGLAAGAAWGLVLVWVAGAVALELPGEPALRRAAERSAILRRLDALAPPADVVSALARIDRLPVVAGPPPPAPSDRRVLAAPPVERAAASVVRVAAAACGLGVEGSGWVAAPHRVVTAAHVVAGAGGVRVDGLPATVWAIDRRTDTAVLDAPGLAARPLRFGEPRAGRAVAILGYPGGGPLRARAGRLGATADLLVGGTLRRVTALSGPVRPGDSGGPALDASGVVRATVVAARAGAGGGYGVPAATVRAVLARARRPVPTGSC